MNSLKKWANALKQNVYAIYLASKDKRVSKFVTLLIIAIVAYAISPIDLVPDFIPILGVLDDLILLPLGIYVVIRLIPPKVWQECSAASNERISGAGTSNTIVVSLVILIWLVTIGVVSYFIFKHYNP